MMSLSKLEVAIVLDDERMVDRRSRLLSILRRRQLLLKRRNELAMYLVTELSLRKHKSWRHTLRTGAWWQIVKRMSDAEFQDNFRISKRTYCFLTEKLHMMARQDTNYRECIPLEKRIAVAVYAISSSAEYRTLAHLFGIGKSTICEIVKEFVFLVVEECTGLFIRMPTSKRDVESAAKSFEDVWGFPQCIGAIDGTHIPIHPPKSVATAYYNYKGFYSLVLLAVVDYQYRFIYVDVGSPGRNNDSFVLQNSSLYEFMKENDVFTSLKKNWNGTDVQILIIADSAFPLMLFIMKPYAEHIDMPDVLKLFNYTLSKGRAVSENAFGRMKARFRILRKLENTIPIAQNIILTACVLNNMCEIFGDYFDPSWLPKSPPPSSAKEPVCTQGEKDEDAAAVRDSIATYLFAKK